MKIFIFHCEEKYCTMHKKLINTFYCDIELLLWFYCWSSRADITSSVCTIILRTIGRPTILWCIR